MRVLNRVIGISVGAVLLAAGIFAVVFLDFSAPPPPPESIIRPIKSAIAMPADAAQQRRFRGEVVPGKTVDLAFQVGGRIVQADLSLGRRVQENAILARLDTTPLEQQIAVLEPTVKQTAERLRQIRELVQQGAATPSELTDAEAAYEQAAAQLKIAQQAKADATLEAPYASLIVQRFYERFENVQARQPVVRLQDISSVDVRVELPESIVARYRSDRPGQAHVRFAALPDLSFPVKVKEASAEANPITGGYPVTFTMSRPEEATLLPGMGATIILTPPEPESSNSVAIPIQAVFVDDSRGRCVWRLTEKGQYFAAEKVPVTVARMTAEMALVSEGLQSGCRVATAGVHFLEEGQVVRPMEPSR